MLLGQWQIASDDDGQIDETKTQTVLTYMSTAITEAVHFKGWQPNYSLI